MPTLTRRVLAATVTHFKILVSVAGYTPPITAVLSSSVTGFWNEIKGWASSTHGDARDGHGSEGGKASFFSLLVVELVVELKSGYSLRYNL